MLHGIGLKGSDTGHGLARVPSGRRRGCSFSTSGNMISVVFINNSDSSENDLYTSMSFPFLLSERLSIGLCSKSNYDSLFSHNNHLILIIALQQISEYHILFLLSISTYFKRMFVFLNEIWYNITEYGHVTDCQTDKRCYAAFTESEDKYAIIKRKS